MTNLDAEATLSLSHQNEQTHNSNVQHTFLGTAPSRFLLESYTCERIGTHINVEWAEPAPAVGTKQELAVHSTTYRFERLFRLIVFDSAFFLSLFFKHL